MVQIIESRYRVLEIDQDDVLLTDIADTGLPVHVEKDSDTYNESLQESVERLKPGNVIEAEIKSESITRQDDFWHFLDLNIIDNTQFHFIENADIHSSHVDELESIVARSPTGSARKKLTSNGRTIGLITVAEDQGDSFWNGLRAGLNTHEYDIASLESISDPPYEVLYMRTSRKDKLVFYQFAEQHTRTAEALISANSQD